MRSSFCDSSACIEVASDGEQVLVRASEAPDFVIVATQKEWKAFVRGVQTGEFNLEQI